MLVMTGLSMASAAAAECAYADLNAVPVPTERILEPLLVRSSVVVMRFGDRDPQRYFSVVDVGRLNPSFGDEVWLSSKTGRWPHADGMARVAVRLGCDAMLRGCGDERNVTADPRVAHNLAVRLDSAGFWGMGGQTMTKMPVEGHRHDAMVRLRRTVRMSATSRSDVENGSYQTSDGGLDEASPGCVERRLKYTYCQYDGRFALADLGSRLLVYARANTNPAGGGRFVSVASANSKGWNSFDLVRFARGPSAFARIFSNHSLANDFGDIYTAFVAKNPFTEAALVGLFSATYNDSFSSEAAIFAALSCNGVDFSPPTPLVKAIPTGHGEINDHVVDGFVVENDDVHFFVHHGVPGTFVKHNKHCLFLEEDSLSHTLPESHISRYTLQAASFRSYTATALRHTPGCSESAGDGG